MAGIQLTGLASGLDWKTLVDQIIQVDSTPITTLQTEQTKVGQQSTALTSIQTKLTALQTSVAALSDPNIFSQTTASSSNSLWSVTAAAGAAATTHTIAVTHLATTAKLQGNSGISNSVRPDGDASQVLISGMKVAQPITAGQFTVNGARVSVAVTDTLADVFQKISDATGGAVTASYNGTSDGVTFNSASPIVLGSANDSSNFLRAMKLGNNGTGTVSSSSRLGAVQLDAPLASAGLSGSLSGLDADNAGKLTVNGVDIAFDADTDSLRTVMARINASAAGVNASYDASNDRMVLTNKVTGDLGVSVQDTTGNLGSVLGLGGSSSLVRGQDAQFTVDGGPTITSASNSIDASTLGVPGLSLTLGSETTERVTVAADSSGARSAIEDFIAKYNEVASYIDQMTARTTTGTKVTNGVLTGVSGVLDVGRSLRQEIFKTGGTGAIARLESLGIDFNGTSNQLTIKDSTKLDAALQAGSADLKSFFTDSTTGFAARFKTLVNNQTGSNGGLVNAVAVKTKRSSAITSQIADIQRRLDAERASLNAKFTAMESMQSTLKTQLQALTNAFKSTTDSSSS